MTLYMFYDIITSPRQNVRLKLELRSCNKNLWVVLLLSLRALQVPGKRKYRSYSREMHRHIEHFVNFAATKYSYVVHKIVTYNSVIS